MHPIESLKNFCSYLFLGRCRKHDRELSVVHATGHYANTILACVECHPQYRDQVCTPTLPALELPARVPEEVEVG